MRTPHSKLVDSFSDVKDDALWCRIPTEFGTVVARVIPAQSYMTGAGIHELKRAAAAILGVNASFIVWQLDIRTNTLGHRDGFLFHAWQR